jgi:hypothetical protein
MAPQHQQEESRMTIVTPPPAIDRDRWGRPLVTPPEGGKKVAYTRATTFIDCLDDKFGLQKWMMRMVALGLADRADLLLSVSAHRDDKRELDRICESAKEAAAASAAATTGTALHALTELIDRGQDLPVLPDAAQADLGAYRAATSALKATHIEQFCVQDPLRIGGTPDRVVELGGKRYIADIKTGSIEWGALKIAMQLALYARSRTYDVATGTRGTHGADTTRGLIIHLPAGTATCSLHWVDLEAGWEAVQVAKAVREQRNLKFKDVTEPFDGTAPATTIRATRKVETKASDAQAHRLADIEKQLLASPTRDAALSVWEANEDVWTDHLTDVAKRHIASLPAAVAG